MALGAGATLAQQGVGRGHVQTQHGVRLGDVPDQLELGAAVPSLNTRLGADVSRLNRCGYVPGPTRAGRGRALA